jgi:hypothetical protein
MMTHKAQNVKIYFNDVEIKVIKSFKFKTPMYLKILWKIQKVWGWVKSL